MKHLRLPHRCGSRFPSRPGSLNDRGRVVSTDSCRSLTRQPRRARFTVLELLRGELRRETCSRRQLCSPGRTRTCRRLRFPELPVIKEPDPSPHLHNTHQHTTQPRRGGGGGSWPPCNSGGNNMNSRVVTDKMSNVRVGCVKRGSQCSADGGEES